MDDKQDEFALVKSQPAELTPLQPTGNQGISAPVSGGGVNHLVMNCVVPGLGSLVAGKTGIGLGQLGLFLGALPMLLISWKLAPLMVLAAYIWSIVTGVGFLKAPKQMQW